MLTLRKASRSSSKFQCSSASRKFLNHRDSAPVLTERHRFSALQRAENSSIKRAQQRVDRAGSRGFSALQRAENSSIAVTTPHLLFFL